MFPFEILSYAGVLGSLSQRNITDDFCSLLKYLMLPFPIPAFPFDCVLLAQVQGRIYLVTSGSSGGVQGVGAQIAWWKDAVAGSGRFQTAGYGFPLVPATFLWCVPRVGAVVAASGSAQHFSKSHLCFPEIRNVNHPSSLWVLTANCLGGCFILFSFFPNQIKLMKT